MWPELAQLVVLRKWFQVLRRGRPDAAPKAIMGDQNQKYLAKSLCLAWLCWCWRHAACIPPGTDSACSGPKLKGRLHSAHTGSMFPTTLWESPRAKFQRLSSEDCRTPVRGQAVDQSAEFRSALEFFATAQMFIIHIFNSVHPFSCRGHGVCESRNLGMSVVRLFVSSRSESHVSGCRSDHWCRV